MSTPPNTTPTTPNGAPAAGATGANPPATGAASAALTGTPAAPAAGAAPAAPAAAGAAPEWTSGLDDGMKGFVGNKGWKNPADVLTSYQNLEKLVGAPQDKIVKLPDGDDEAGWNAVYSKLGRPEKPEGYKFDMPKDADPEFAKWAQANFHKNGLSGKQAENMVKAWNEYQAGIVTAQKTELEQAITQERQQLQREWGAAYETNTKIASRAAKEFGVTAEVIDAMEIAMGHDGVMKFFHSIGSKLGEGSFVMGNPNSDGALTPDQAKQRIGQLQSDNEFVKKYTAGDAAARREMERLHKMAYHGESAFH